MSDLSVEDGVALLTIERKGGRPPFQVTDENRDLVLALTINGVTADEVSETLGISKPTLSKYFDEELTHGRKLATAKVARALYRQAIKADSGEKSAVTAAIFYLKTQGRWREEEKPQAPQGNNLSIYINGLAEESKPAVFEQLRSLMYALRGQKELESGE
jgi:hypothetical protein